MTINDTNSDNSKSSKNLEREFFQKFSDFQKDVHHLIDSESDEEFVNWFKVLYKKDKRSLFLYLKSNIDLIPQSRISFCQQFFQKNIVDE